MKIAVLMSTYNGQKFIDKQLKSLSQQTLAQYMTVYIRDDGSNDATIDIILKWGKKINIVLYKGKNVGPVMSFWQLFINNTIEADYFAFCDQDDIWDATKLEVAIEALTGRTCLYICNCRVIDETGEVTRNLRLKERPLIDIQHLFVTGVAQGCSMVFTNALRQWILGKDLHDIPMHDIIIMIYALCYGKVFWDEHPMFSYRMHSNNVVAKNGKSFLKKATTVVWNWHNNGKHSMENVAREMLDNDLPVSREDQDFIVKASQYKSNIRTKITILRGNNTQGISKASVRSYQIRVLLGLW